MAPLAGRSFRYSDHWLSGGASINKEAPLPATSIIHRGNLESSVLATGVLKPKSLVAIGAQATGRIQSLKVRPGQRVQKDDVVALIDSTTQQNELQKRRPRCFRMRLRAIKTSRSWS